MESEWTRFFTLAGIPDGIAARYASSFASNRVTREMVPDLDKDTLIDLGITAVGDQMAVLKRVKAVAAMEKAGSATHKKNPVSAPVRSLGRAPVSAPSIDDRFTTLDERCASVQRRGKPPPDRHEIYHVKMPVGTTAKSRKILQKVEALKRSGLHPRGTSGVRQAGMTVLSVAEQRERDMEVSSTTGGRMGGLHVDRLSGVRGNTGKVIKRRIVGGSSSSSGGLFGAAMAVAGNGPVVMRKKLRVERMDGTQGRLPSVTVQLGNRVRIVGGGGGTSGHKQVVVGGVRKGGLTGRIQRGTGRKEVVVEYEDEEGEEEEEMEDEMYEDEEEEVEYEGEEEFMGGVDMEDEDSSTLIVGGPSSSSSHGSSRVQTRYVPARQNRTQIVHTNVRRAPVVQRNASIFERVQFNR